MELDCDTQLVNESIVILNKVIYFRSAHKPITTQKNKMSRDEPNRLMVLQPDEAFGTSSYKWDNGFCNETKRLKTFENWPLAWLNKNTLAMTGMFYTGYKDLTKCYFCKVTVGQWEYGDDPVQEHLRWSQHCPLLNRRLTNNEPINGIMLDSILPPVNYSVCGNGIEKLPFSVREHNSETYCTEAKRLKTFREWPRGIKQKPQELAEAGFYYSGIGDRVICFSCAGGLKDWEDDDDPWEQHALWMSHCEYVNLVKGESFVTDVSRKFRELTPKNSKDDGYLIKANHIATSNKSIESTLSETNDDKLCKICFDNNCNTAYIPCGHVVSCAKCAFGAKNCPMCRNEIKSVVRIYFS